MSLIFACVCSFLRRVYIYIIISRTEHHILLYIYDVKWLVWRANERNDAANVLTICITKRASVQQTHSIHPLCGNSNKWSASSYLIHANVGKYSDKN